MKICDIEIEETNENIYTHITHANIKEMALEELKGNSGTLFHVQEG